MLIKKKIITLILLTYLTGCSDKIASPIAGPWFNHDRRSVLALTNDQAISVKANLTLAKNKELWKRSHISTLSYNNSLLIVGQTSTENDLKLIEKQIKQIPEIHTFYNQLKVSIPLSLSQRAKDTWITTQLKAKLISNRNIGPNRVKAITENSTVYLMGILTLDEEKIAVNIAKKIKGVEHVVKVLDRFEDRA